jgi:hypothetical protein
VDPRRRGIPHSATSTTETDDVTYKDSFQDRIGNAAKAREKALEKLRAKPPMDAKVVAERVERQAQRAAREAAKAEAKRAEREARAAEKEAKPVAPPSQTEDERKAARDARYAARKSRK